jgi:beta-lactamase class A
MSPRLATLVAPLLLSFIVLACGSGDARTGPAADSLAASTGVEVTPVDSSLFDSLRAIEARSGGTLGFAAVHLESGWRTVYRAGQPFPMASVAKLPMAIAFLRAVDRGRFRLDSVVRMTGADHRPGASRVYHRAMRDSAGMVSLHTLLQAMLVESDNTACDYILRIVGGPRVADDLMKELGLGDIDVSSYEGELILKWAGIDPVTSDSAWTRERIYRKIEEAGRTAWEEAQARLIDDPHDAASPESLARLLAAVASRRILSPAMSDTLVAIMSRATTGRGRIAGGLPPGTRVAHKTGTIGSVANDAGIVFLPDGGHLVIVALVKGSKVGVHARDRAIAAASALAFRTVER